MSNKKTLRIFIVGMSLILGFFFLLWGGLYFLDKPPDIDMPFEGRYLDEIRPICASAFCHYTRRYSTSVHTNVIISSLETYGLVCQKVQTELHPLLHWQCTGNTSQAGKVTITINEPTLKIENTILDIYIIWEPLL